MAQPMPLSLVSLVEPESIGIGIVSSSEVTKRENKSIDVLQ
jgi:hypothetical protein